MRMFSPRQAVRLLALSVVTVFGFTGAAAAQQQSLTLRGSTTEYPVIERMAATFQRDHPEIEVVVSGGGSQEGIAALLSGEVDIANSSRFISAAELQLAHEKGIYPIPFRFADDCILPIVHKSNRVRELSLRQLRGIYAGGISNWSEVGGADEPIRVVSRTAASGTYGVWNDRVMAGDRVVSSQPLQPSNDGVVRAVSAARGAIGYIGLGNLNASVKPLRVAGVMGSRATVADGSYPLSRPLFIFTRGWPTGRILEFINFATDPHGGQLIVEEMGFVPLYNHKNNH